MDKFTKYQVARYISLNNLEFNAFKLEMFFEKFEKFPFILKLIFKMVLPILSSRLLQKSIVLKSGLLNKLNGLLLGNLRLLEESTLLPTGLDYSRFNSGKKLTEVDTEIIYDEIIIGSGPGGSIAALDSVKRNSKVLLVEKGLLFDSGSIEHHSYKQTKLQFKNEGMNFMWGLPPVLYAEGETLGGGSEVNSGLYHRLGGKYRATYLELLKISEENWNEIEVEIEKKISVNFEPTPYKVYSTLGLVDGSRVNNFICKEIPRWRKYSPAETHQGMLNTYIPEAIGLGLKILTNTHIDSLNLSSNFITLRGKSGDNEVSIKTKKVVLSAGTIGTPQILRNSNLAPRSLDMNFHPMLRVVADHGVVVNDGDLFPPWQSWTSDLNFKFGYSVSNFPYLAATLVSLGEKNRINQDKLQQFCAYFSSFTLEDSVSKLISISGQFTPIVRWGKKDKEKLEQSVTLLKQILIDGGCTEVWPKSGIPPISTVHIFGSLPLIKSKLIDTYGKLIVDSRIRISDASILPAPPFGNPQGIIMVLCQYLANKQVPR